MKHSTTFLRSHIPWLFLLFAVDGFAALLLWIADARAFPALAGAFFLATCFLFLTVCFVLVRHEKKKRQAFLDFLDSPDRYREQLLLDAVTADQREALRLLAKALRERQDDYAALATQLSDYEEYVESWAHETKTPLSLLTLLLDNHGEALPPAVRIRLDYIRSRMQESVDQMLFYARLKGTRADYLFEQLSLRACVEEVLEDYAPLLSEKQFRVECAFDDVMVCSDRRGLRFLLGQLVSNSIKYCGSSPALHFELRREDSADVLCVRDNGTGVKSCDMPYIFEKGFTGSLPENRRNATGMGLYLAKGIAHALNLTLAASSEWGDGFEMRVSFPIVETTDTLD